jgi:hypothetical protein
MNLDRFSQPMSREFSRPSVHFLDEQQELNKRDIVQTFAMSYADEMGSLPNIQDVQELFYPLDLDDSLVQDELDKLQGVLSWV